MRCARASSPRQKSSGLRRHIALNWSRSNLSISARLLGPSLVADSIHSVVRASVIGPESPRITLAGTNHYCACPPASQRHYKWALFERDPLPAWTTGYLILLGDAAHPYLGQAAAQAIEDGCVLTTALSVLPDDLAAAPRLYERSRLPRRTRVVLGAGARGNGDQTPSHWAALNETC